MTFEIGAKDVFTLDYQGLHTTTYEYAAHSPISAIEVAEQFIRSAHLTEILYPHGKTGPHYLRPAFDLEELHVDDFKQSDLKGIIAFLVNEINDPDWDEAGRSECAQLIDHFLSLHKESPDGLLFLINKDWFEAGDPKLNSPEDWIFSFYWLIINIVPATCTLTVSEFYED